MSTISIRIHPLYRHKLLFDDHPIVGIQEELVVATGAHTDDELAAALRQLRWHVNVPKDDEPSAAGWWAIATVVTPCGVEQLHLEAQHVPAAGGLCIYAPGVEGETSAWSVRPGAPSTAS